MQAINAAEIRRQRIDILDVRQRTGRVGRPRDYQTIQLPLIGRRGHLVTDPRAEQQVCSRSNGKGLGRAHNVGRRVPAPVHINVAALNAVRTGQRQKQLLRKRLFEGDAFSLSTRAERS